MIKSLTFFGLIIASIVVSVPSFAEEPLFPSKAEADDAMYSRLKESRLNVPETKKYLEYLKEQLNKMKTMSDDEIKEAKTESFWLKRISKIPREYMPYFAPALFENKAVPKSVLEKPYVKQFKGKLPKNIAPEVQDVVKKYGKNISPDYYYLMMPDIYEAFKHKQTKDEKAKTEVVKEFKIKKGEDATKIFKVRKPTPIITNNLAKIDFDDPFIKGEVSKVRNKEITNETKLTNQDVLDFISSIPDVRMVVENKEGIFKMQSVADIKGENPCDTFLKKVDKIGYQDKIETAIKKYNFDLKSWGNTCARVFRASTYGSLNLDKTLAMYNQNILADLLKKTTSSYYVDIDDYKALYPYQRIFYLSLAKDMFLIGPYSKRNN